MRIKAFSHRIHKQRHYEHHELSFGNSPSLFQVHPQFDDLTAYYISFQQNLVR